ncbi:MAG TPA: hypothetical protein DCY20_05985 [Firmicutes bacterium]|nr:hypothetical protein [Bacillota bacterium]
MKKYIEFSKRFGIEVREEKTVLMTGNGYSNNHDNLLKIMKTKEKLTISNNDLYDKVKRQINVTYHL